MANRSAGIGPVPEGLDESLTFFLNQLRRMAVDAQRGLSNATAPAPGDSTVVVIGGGGGGGTPYTPDLTPPPTPTTVSVIAGLDFVGITTDAPTFTEGHGYDRTIVYGVTYGGTGPLPTFSDAVRVHEFVGQVGSFPTEPALQWHIWLKWRTKDAVESSSPAGGTNGYQVTTGTNIAKLLEVLTGAITRNEIDADVWRTDTFAIAPPAGSPLPEILPFVVQTTDETVNGVLIPAGVYMDAAFIRNLSALVARLGNAWITNAMIQSLAASKIIAGSIAVGEYIQSSDYVAGASGWRIGGNGFAEIAAAAIRGLLTAAQIDTRNLDIRDGAGNVIFSAGQNLAWSRVANRPVAYRANSRGYLTTTSPHPNGVYNAETGAAVVAQPGAGYCITKINRTTGAASFVMIEQPLNSGTGANIAAALNAIGSDHVVVVTTYDEPSTNRLTGGLPAAIYRCGGSSGKFLSSQFNYRCAYVLVGIPGCGEGNGIEVLTPYDGANSWASVAFSLMNGDLLTPAQSALFQITSANVSSYLASAVIGSAYISDLAVTNAKIANLAVDNLKLGDLAVSTLKVQDRAITQPAAGQAISVVATTTETTCLNLGWMDLTVNGVAQPLYMHVGFEGQVQAAATGGGLTNAVFRVYVGGVLRGTYTFSATVPGGIRQHVKNDPIYVASPPTGLFSVTVTAQLTGNTGGGADSAITVTLFALGTKR